MHSSFQIAVTRLFASKGAIISNYGITASRSVFLVTKQESFLNLSKVPVQQNVFRSFATAASKKPETPALPIKEKKPSAMTTIPYEVTPDLAALIGKKVSTRADMIKGVWEYIRTNKLQNELEKTKIKCDPKMKKVFGGVESIKQTDIMGGIAKHTLKKLEVAAAK